MNTTRYMQSLALFTLHSSQTLVFHLVLSVLSTMPVCCSKEACKNPTLSLNLSGEVFDSTNRIGMRLLELRKAIDFLAMQEKVKKDKNLTEKEWDAAGSAMLHCLWCCPRKGRKCRRDLFGFSKPRKRGHASGESIGKPFFFKLRKQVARPPPSPFLAQASAVLYCQGGVKKLGCLDQSAAQVERTTSWAKKW